MAENECVLGVKLQPTELRENGSSQVEVKTVCGRAAELIWSWCPLLLMTLGRLRLLDAEIRKLGSR